MNEKELRLDMKVDKRLALRIASGVMSMAIIRHSRSEHHFFHHPRRSHGGDDAHAYGESAG